MGAHGSSHLSHHPELPRIMRSFTLLIVSVALASCALATDEITKEEFKEEKFHTADVFDMLKVDGSQDLAKAKDVGQGTPKVAQIPAPKVAAKVAPEEVMVETKTSAKAKFDSRRRASYSSRRRYCPPPSPSYSSSRRRYSSSRRRY